MVLVEIDGRSRVALALPMFLTHHPSVELLPCFVTAFFPQAIRLHAGTGRASGTLGRALRGENLGHLKAHFHVVLDSVRSDPSPWLIEKKHLARTFDRTRMMLNKEGADGRMKGLTDLRFAGALQDKRFGKRRVVVKIDVLSPKHTAECIEKVLWSSEKLRHVEVRRIDGNHTLATGTLAFAVSRDEPIVEDLHSQKIGIGVDDIANPLVAPLAKQLKVLQSRQCAVLIVELIRQTKFRRRCLNRLASFLLGQLNHEQNANNHASDTAKDQIKSHELTFRFS
jgi:hypothetical protein